MASRQFKLDDEFFGNDDDEVDSHRGNSDAMAKYDTRARETQFKNVGYLEAYEASKETRLQEGFETGYREVYDNSIRVGELLGEITAASLLLDNILDSADLPKMIPVKLAAASVLKCLEQVDQGATDTGEADALMHLESKLSALKSSIES
jgi:hypothetical protein